MERIVLHVTVKNNTPPKHHERRRHHRSLGANKCVNELEKTASKLSKSAVTAQRILQMDLHNSTNTVSESTSPHRKSNTRRTTDSVTSKVSVDDTHLTTDTINATVAEAMEAVNNIREDMNRMELEEKTKVLEKIPKELRVDKLSKELRRVTLKRIRYDLQTPYSEISSSDAKYYLESMNVSDKKSIVGKIISKRKNYTINNDIDTLEDAEAKCFSKTSENTALIDKVNIQKKVISNAQVKARKAKEIEEKARQALIAAEERTHSWNQALEESESSLSHIQVDLDKSAEELTNISKVLERQQEKVRKYLLTKEKSAVPQDTKDDDSTSTTIQKYEETCCSSSSLDGSEFHHTTLEELNEEELSLEAEFKKIEDRLLRIKSKRESYSPPSTLYTC